MSLVFYYAPWSSASTCLWALEELGVPVEKVKLDLKAKATHTPEYLALNPNGKVPLLVHDGVPIFESIAILAHLGETFGVEKKLFPGPGIERAQAFQWLAWMNVSLGAAAGRYLHTAGEHVPAELRNPKAGEVFKAEVMANLAILEAHLAKHPWMVGDHFTLVDLHLTGGVGWIGAVGFDLSKFPSIKAWAAKNQSRPAAAVVTKA